MADAKSAGRCLVVLADGAQAAFAAAVVGALARAGVCWERGVAAGLGAQIAALALLDEAEEAERRWQRQGSLGCPLLRPALGRARQRLAGHPGMLVLPDPWALGGWLDPDALGQHLAPEAADLPGRLRSRGRRCAVGVVEMAARGAVWRELTELDAAAAAGALGASASFPGGWAPRDKGESGPAEWGGAAPFAASWATLRSGPTDLVCGFPIPAVGRVTGGALFELVQQRDQVLAAEGVADALGDPAAAGVRLVAPSPAQYAEWAARDGADLALEWPLPGEHNAELVANALSLGRFMAERALAVAAPAAP